MSNFQTGGLARNIPASLLLCSTEGEVAPNEAAYPIWPEFAGSMGGDVAFRIGGLVPEFRDNVPSAALGALLARGRVDAAQAEVGALLAAVLAVALDLAAFAGIAGLGHSFLSWRFHCSGSYWSRQTSPYSLCMGGSDSSGQAGETAVQTRARYGGG